METKEGNESAKRELKEEPDMEMAITSAIGERVGHFKEQADLLGNLLQGYLQLANSLFDSRGGSKTIRRGFGVGKIHIGRSQKFIKKCLDECLSGAENVSRSSVEVIHSSKNKTELSEEPEREVKDNSNEEEIMKESPVTIENEAEEARDVQVDEVLSEETIKKAIKSRASYFRSNAQSLTMVGVRRLLEEDMKLAISSLDPFKKIISGELDKILSSEIAEPTNGAKKKPLMKVPQRKPVKNLNRKESSDSEESGDEEEEVEEEVKSKKEVAPKGKTQKPDARKSIKRPAKEVKTPSNKKKKITKPMSDGSSDEKDAGNVSEDGHSQSSAEEPIKKREVSAQVYGKRVEHLKLVIKSCGMSIPPQVYKRAKQAPESKREDILIKELTEILKKEGLSKNPSEKEIKDVKKRKQTTKELEGIDLSNIVSSSRRRSTSSYTAPPKPKIVESESEEDAEDQGDDSNEDTDEGLNDEVEEESD
ncbi:hypothetical protein GIB67_003035 [Kingdonia uniflora]|uniref:Histone chaperone domain-containing protein n=1 Tax=Kingdonia uniflora TaxID=39325 RepID=A0A7J7LYR5_9MAGN|nr:hypothetical protein GIB67_003035 [Kingdonia uniflora]